MRSCVARLPFSQRRTYREHPLPAHLLVSELVDDGGTFAVPLQVLKFSRQPHYCWRKQQFAESELVEAHRASGLFDAHQDGPEHGYRFLVGGA